MLAALFKNPNVIDVIEYQLKKPEKTEVVVKIGACGVCGTDFHIVEGSAPAKSPVIIGHEFTGEVVEKGNGISGLKVGDKVAVDPNIYCGFCEFCRKGKINLCKNLKALGVTINGGFAEYCIVPAKQAYALPDKISYKQAAFAEPLSCCVHGINQSGIKQGDNVAIIGSGPIGLLMLQLSVLAGAMSVTVIDFSLLKLKIAKKLGATNVFIPDDMNSLNEFIEFTKGGADVVIECAGNRGSGESTFKFVKKGGTILLFGLADRQAYVNLYLQSFFHNELTIKSSLLNPFTFQSAIDLITAGKINVEIFEPTIIHLSDEKINTLFKSPRDLSVVKYIIKPNGEEPL